MSRYTPTGTIYSVGAVNAELEKISEAIEATLSREGESPNQMGASIDMNGNTLLNLGESFSPTSPIRRMDLDADVTIVEDVITDRKDRGIFNVKDYGAVGDNITDDTQAIRDAIAAVNANGGGVLYLPVGRYRTSGVLPIVENMHVQGEGMFQSVIKRTDDSSDSRVFEKSSGIEELTRISFDSLTLEGIWDVVRREITGSLVSARGMREVYFTNVRFMHGTGFGININRCLRVVVNNCRFFRICRDMCGVWATPQVIVTNNSLVGNDDDAISLNNESLFGTFDGENIKSQLIVANNILEDTGAIRIQQAKIAVVHSNTLTRCKGGSGIHIGAKNAGGERVSNPHSIILTDNNIIDMIDRSVSTELSSNLNFRMAFKIEGLQPKAADGQTTIAGEIDPATGKVHDPYGSYYTHSQGGNTGEVRRFEGLLVVNNNVKRTLPAVSNYSDWGFGAAFTRFATDTFSSQGFYDGPVTEDMLSINGMRIEGSLKNAVLRGNVFAGSGDFGIWAQTSSPPSEFSGDTRKLQWDNFLIENNEFYDFRQQGVRLEGLFQGLYQDVFIRQNVFNGDPFIKNIGRGPVSGAKDGSWLSQNNCVGVGATNVAGVKIIENTFKNLSIPYLLGSNNSGTVVTRNIFVGEPAENVTINTFNTQNKGLGLFPNELVDSRSLLVRENSDPSDLNYRKPLAGQATYVPDDVPPPEGFYFKGQFLPSKKGDGVIGLRRKTTGTGTSPVTDWEYLTTSTGTISAPVIETSGNAEHDLYLIAHRGFRNMSPQNTMLAMTTAVRRGADALECDVSYSADNTGYLYHDSALDTLTDVSGPFSSATDTTINSAAFTELTGSVVFDERIPTFEEFVKYASEAGVFIYPEIKSVNSNANIDDMLSILETYNMIDKTVLQSFSLSDLQYVRSVNSEVQVGLLGSSSDPVVYEKAVNDLADLGKGWLLWRHIEILSTPAIVEYSKQKNVKIGTYTVNDVDNAKALMRLGVRHIMSDINLETA